MPASRVIDRQFYLTCSSHIIAVSSSCTIIYLHFLNCHTHISPVSFVKTFSCSFLGLPFLGGFCILYSYLHFILCMSEQVSMDCPPNKLRDRSWQFQLLCFYIFCWFLFVFSASMKLKFHHKIFVSASSNSKFLSKKFSIKNIQKEGENKCCYVEE